MNKNVQSHILFEVDSVQIHRVVYQSDSKLNQTKP